MKLCYIVYREEGVMVYQSQVLEYLKNLKDQRVFDEIELVVFRHEKNLNNKSEVEKQILQYIDFCISYATLPVLSLTQLDISVLQLKSHIRKKYNTDDKVAVICRGDLAGYVGTKAFRTLPNSRVLFDNRGLAYEESVMSHGNQMIHQINRNIKRKALHYAKLHCDMYNFVTLPMRNYFLREYGYLSDIPYTIIPTLYKAEVIDDEGMKQVIEAENYSEADYVVSYIGSIQAWQSIDQLTRLIVSIAERIPQAKFLFLMNGQLPGKEQLPESIQERITVKTVPHSQMKYYLNISDLGIVIRDNNIVNRVAAPTKIAEYLTNGVRVLYSGEIGIIHDLQEFTDSSQMINMDCDENWLDRVMKDYQKREKRIDPAIVSYFDMNARQQETIAMIRDSFERNKVTGDER